jgi:uncharacterized protein
MTYATDRDIHDADAHIMEPPSWLADHADPAWRDRLPPLYVNTLQPGESDGLERYESAHADPRYRADDANQIMLRKNFAATGSFLADDRPTALDHLGFASQLIFNTFASGYLAQHEQESASDLVSAAARAHNRAMLAFCSADSRLLPTCYVPLHHFDAAVSIAAEAIDGGAAALLIASACPREHSPSHVELDRVWALAQDAGVPVVLHVGGGGRLLSPKYFVNGLPPVPDFHGGAENFRSIDYMAIPYPPMQTMSTLIFDGVLDRFPRLKWGVIEQGASWVPGLLRNLDAAFVAFRKNEARLQRLSAPPSEIFRRQVRVTPYPHEDTGWIVRESGPEVCMFSSDYPHVEGGRNPLARFDRSLNGSSDATVHAFYFDNFVDLMGDVLVRRGLPTVRTATAATPAP